MVTEQPRMSRLPGFLVVVGLSLIATLGVGCKQGEGERCEQTSDCSSGLRCSRTEVSAEAGRCEVPPSGPSDASADNDAGVIDDDAGTDAGDDAPGTDAAADAAGDAAMTSDAADAPADMSVPSDAAPADAASDASAD